MINEHKITFTNNRSNTVCLYQYDKGQIFLFDENFKNGTEVQFGSGEVKVIQDGKITVPDAVLERFGLHSAWIQLINADNETTIYEIAFEVVARAKKNDYVEPEDEQSFREEVQQMIETAGRPTPEEIDPIVRDYLEKNPPAAYDDREVKRRISALEAVDIDAKVATGTASYVNAHKAELKGDKGDKGETGAPGPKGADGTNGTNGKDGYTPIKGKDYFDGINGKDGADGKDGYTPIKGVDYFDGKDGANGKDGQNGKDGENYVITSSDYDAIADVVLGKIPMAESEEY